MDLLKDLESLGLPNRESKTYLALLKIGSTTSSKIIRETGIPSSKIYDVLERLEHRGLVSHTIKNGKKEFRAINPEKLLNMVKEKENIVQNILPTLKQLFKDTKEETTTEIYKGKEGMKNIFNDILKEKKEWMVLGASGKGISTLPAYLPEFYLELKKNKIKTKILFVDNVENRKQAKELEQYTNITIKFIPKTVRNLMVTFIYSNKIFIIPITETTEISPTGILIKSKESAEGYKDYFNWLWSMC